VFYFTKAVLPQMIRNRWGRAINIASIAGAAVGFPRLTHYSATKAALVGFARSLAPKVAQFNTAMSAVAPGPLETPGDHEGVPAEQLKVVRRLIPVGRVGKPQGMAGVVLFLASEEASFIAGQLVVADGGCVTQ